MPTRMHLCIQTRIMRARIILLDATLSHIPTYTRRFYIRGCCPVRLTYTHPPRFCKGMSPTGHSMAAGALSLLLVFRTNSAYDRFWEGRKLWGKLVNFETQIKFQT